MLAFPTTTSIFEAFPSTTATTTHTPTELQKRRGGGFTLTCATWLPPDPRTICCTTTAVMPYGYCENPTGCPRDYDFGQCPQTKYDQTTHDQTQHLQIKRLSMGAIAGIVVGVIVFVAIVIGLIIRKKRRSKSAAPRTGPEHTGDANAARDGAPRHPQMLDQEAGAPVDAGIELRPLPHVEPAAEAGHRNVPLGTQAAVDPHAAGTPAVDQDIDNIHPVNADQNEADRTQTHQKRKRDITSPSNSQGYGRGAPRSKRTRTEGVEEGQQP